MTREIQKGIQNLVWQNRISKNIAINQFLNPEGEEVDDDLKVIMDKIAKAYSIGDRIYEIDKENIVMPKVGYFEAIKSFQKLWLYKE